MKKTGKKSGFTIAELLIVVAIVAVLVAISIPIFSKQLEKSREATDLANVRSAYAQVMAAAIAEDKSVGFYHSQTDRWEIVVDLKQKEEGWQSATPLTVGGISSTDPMHWVGFPRPGGTCTVSYMSARDAVLDWDINFLPIFDLSSSTGDTYNGKTIAQLIGDMSFTKVESSGSTGRSYAESVKNLLGLQSAKNFSYLITKNNDTGYYNIYISTDYTLKTEKEKKTAGTRITVTGYIYDVATNTIVKKGTPQNVSVYINASNQEKIQDKEYLWD